MIAQKQTVFKQDPAGRKMKITREFDAPVDKVWRAWTDSELLEKWWAPRPWKAVTTKMDFREGGSYHYYMQGPEGEKHHCVFEYRKIEPQKSFSGIDAFTDENGKVNAEMPRMDWTVNFLEKDDHTLVDIEIIFESEEAMKQIVEMGFKEGFSMAHQNLDELLAS